jgi:hypothetical protein
MDFGERPRGPDHAPRFFFYAHVATTASRRGGRTVPAFEFVPFEFGRSVAASSGAVATGLRTASGSTTAEYSYNNTEQTGHTVYSGTPSALGTIQSSQQQKYDLQGA